MLLLWDRFGITETNPSQMQCHAITSIISWDENCCTQKHQFFGIILVFKVLLNGRLSLQPWHHFLHEFDLTLHGHIVVLICAGELGEPDLLAELLVVLHQILQSPKAAPVAVDGNGINAATLAGLQELSHPPSAFANVSAHGWADQGLHSVVSCHAFHFWPDGCGVPWVHSCLVVDVRLIEAQQGSELPTPSVSWEVVVVHHGKEIHVGTVPLHSWIQLPIVAPGHALLQGMQLVFLEIGLRNPTLMRCSCWGDATGENENQEAALFHHLGV